MARTKVFYFIPNLQQGGPEGQILELINQLPPRFEPVLCVYHARRRLLGRALPARAAGARSRRAADEPRARSIG